MLNNKIIKLNYIDHFDSKFKIIIKVDLFKSCMDITRIDETSLRFAIDYSISKWKWNNLWIIVFYINFKMKWLKLLYKTIIHPKWRKKKVEEPWLNIQRDERNLNSKTSVFQPRETDAGGF